MRPDEQAAVGAARGLTDALNGFSERLDRAERRERRLSTILASVAIVVALAVGVLAYLQAQENSARITADRNEDAAFRAQQHTACVDTNQARAEAIVLWDRVLPGAVPRNKLPLLEATVAKYFAAHNCSLSAGISRKVPALLDARCELTPSVRLEDEDRGLRELGVPDGYPAAGGAGLKAISVRRTVA